uniref:Uncharacterized protein n=1 Tax=Panagrolaimus davidi TaxID=227884 RepID=A0A914P6Y2_9BILA
MLSFYPFLKGYCCNKLITSISPLRVYIFDGDALIRFCAKEYEPFDAEDIDRYVVGDDYTPVWEMPSLKNFFVNRDLTFKETLNAYLKSVKKDSEEIWNQIHEIIRRVFESQNSKMIASAKGYQMNKNYFELSRFDFVVDSNLKVFLMEANMSPNLSSGHFKQNRLLYEQVIFNVLSLVGATSSISSESAHSKNVETKEMQLSYKDLNVHFPECDAIDAAASSSLTPEKDDCISCSKNASLICELCKHCLTSEFYEILSQTFLEHLNRRQMRRILPRNFGENGETELTEKDLLLSKWLEIKCKQNRHFCE